MFLDHYMQHILRIEAMFALVNVNCIFHVDWIAADIFVWLTSIQPIEYGFVDIMTVLELIKIIKSNKLKWNGACVLLDILLLDILYHNRH